VVWRYCKKESEPGCKLTDREIDEIKKENIPPWNIDFRMFV
jgi:hypothetical protein